ncbi:tyrosine-protein kinase SYK-like isoform X1 [Lethenteron reissneri]|uniref:tyrosine-protein kinase SYK-like isoform X1 n=1 Tax=Lethenteron reissneri TaxID=7753 RepID=UPI002AB74E5D|nr:tyrosine-protein kinase SYK-like isoform X1 [Lethenteron reissneri]XP_061433740.1 tyrosine-protein kinase SYK-like isoform X1 [Lethenteron reissneri]XP_061433741.1 tyrosine-protein kinase SYK-like isoform X1 [Lethenteron reissneri]XP_061433742.1 tyrosine-protein kinase SYK-like isoform X1 [Lethenteron reissneri]XP_061433743.1 tyrosine-protein kinase SYK-like isoform X1 [Lethenteron reissneri]
MDASGEPLPYYFGHVGRDEAEGHLRAAGFVEGLFLLRKSTSTVGGLVLSVVCRGRVHHYEVEPRPYDTGPGLEGRGCGIDGGRTHAGPAELCAHHEHGADGLCCPLAAPCHRPDGTPPRSGYFEDVKDQTIRDYVHKKYHVEGAEADALIARQRPDLEKEVASSLHEKLPWFHGSISRKTSEERLLSQRQVPNGRFLIRQRNTGGSFAISLVFKKKVFHYVVDTDKSTKLSIPEGRKFDALWQMVEHYSMKEDGLMCALGEACICPEYVDLYGNYVDQARTHEPTRKNWFSSSFPSALRLKNLIPAITNGFSSPEPPIENPGPVQNNVYYSKPPLPGAAVSDAEGEGVYSDLSDLRCIFLNRNLLQLQHNTELGSGNFGTVQKGTYTLAGKEVQVAVKVLKPVENQEMLKKDLMKEAELMHQLDHPFIVKMFGVCEGEALMLVMEMAPLGALNKYLREHRYSGTMPVENILELMHQVSAGMKYLEERNFVHRDLAARNVLLVNERYAKISDFGLSKALANDEYYKASNVGRWPIKWYAPECINYRRFTSKGDVWSFGVTMWEAFSFGSKPYPKMKGHEVLVFLESGMRLDKPEHCPDPVYQIMLAAWNLSPDARPMFQEIDMQLESLKNETLNLGQDTLPPKMPSRRSTARP